MNPIEENMYDEKQAAKILHLSVKTLQAYRYQGKGPSYRKIGAKVRYTESQLNEFLRQSEVSTN